MYKIRRTNDGVQLFDTFDFYNTPNIGWTSWEIIKNVKKYGTEKAVKKIRSSFNITEKEAKEDI